MFSGGGLGDYGLTLAGMEIVGQVEIDEYCQKVLALRWPDVPKWRDIREVHTKEKCPMGNTGGEGLERHSRKMGKTKTIASRSGQCPGCIDIGRIDLISGGFPCQDISTAGKGAGITGERSGLWKEMLRIIREVRPKYVLVENVTALLGRGLGVVLGDLAESGYDAEWDCIPASALGAPHQRDRVWIVAHSRHGGWRDGERGSVGGYGLGEHEAKKRSGTSAPTSRPDKTSGALADPKSKEVADSDQKRLEGKRTERCQEGRQDKRGSTGLRNGASRSDKRGEVRNTASARLPHRSIFPMGKRGKIKESERSNWWAVEPNVGRVAHGVAKRVDRLKLLGNGQVTFVVAYVAEQIMRFDAETKNRK